MEYQVEVIRSMNHLKGTVNRKLKREVVVGYWPPPTPPLPVLLDDEGEMNNFDLNNIVWKCKQVFAN